MLPLSFMLSVLVHAILLPLLVILFARSLTEVLATTKPQHAAPLFVIEQRIRPAIHPARPHAQPQRQPIPEPHPTEAPPPPRELAKLVPKAAPEPPQAPVKPSLGSQIAAQERAFAREAQQLHAENNPLAVPTGDPGGSGYQGKHFDATAQEDQPERYYALLTPTNHWIDGDRSCYYVTYDMNTSQGGQENGNIPWPICYPRNNDRMLPLDRPHELPIPVPPPEFVLQSGTYLTPFLRGIYDQRGAQ